MRQAEIITFNVGQGLFNLVRGEKDDGSPYFGVFDCGNFQEYRNRIDDACVILNNDPNFVYFDDVVISHQDIDHWRMFLEFVLKLNGFTKDSTSWFRLSKTLLFNYISDSAFQKLDITATKAIHSVFVFSKNFNANAYGNVDRVNTPDWTINVSDIKRFFSITIKPKFGLQDTFEISFLGNNPKLEKPEPIISAGNGIYNEVINIISLGFASCNPEMTNEIYKIINTVFRDIHLSYDEYDEMISAQIDKPIVKGRIIYLHLGGQMLGNTYSAFCSLIGLFASMTYHAFAFTQITPDNTDNRITHSTIRFEFAIQGHTGTSDFSAPNIYKNATSQITSFVLSSDQFALFPGDATVHTFSSVNDKLQQHPFSDMQLFIAPHHGSYHTNFAFEVLESGNIDFCDEQPLANLFTNFPPANIHISANHTKFGHPSASFVQLCRNHCRNFTYEHYILCCDNKETVHNSYYKMLSVKPVFTTENSGHLHFNHPSNALSNSSILNEHEQPKRDILLPNNDLFVAHGGFNL